MLLRACARLMVVSVSVAFAATFANAAETPEKPHVPLETTAGRVTPTGPVPSLAVLNAQGATLSDGKLTLTGIANNTIVFADRPVRAAGHQTTAKFIEQWDEGKDSYAIGPPNATVSVLGGAGENIALDPVSRDKLLQNGWVNLFTMDAR